jgi:hypothetical protein
MMGAAMLSETRERFAKAILAQVPADQIEEIHFFQPIRQGGVESGVAVLAVSMEEPSEESQLDESAHVGAAESTTDDDTGARPPESVLAMSDVADELEDDCALIPAHTVEPPDESEHERPLELFLEREHSPTEHPAGDDDDPYGEEVPSDLQQEPSSESAEAGRPEQLSSQGSRDDVPIRRTRRFTVFSARYRLVLKGPDRGKWETSMRAEADAPLPTVDLVVRGVLRRAGDAEDAERMTGKELLGRLPNI